MGWIGDWVGGWVHVGGVWTGLVTGWVGGLR